MLAHQAIHPVEVAGHHSVQLLKAGPLPHEKVAHQGPHRFHGKCQRVRPARGHAAHCGPYLVGRQRQRLLEAIRYVDLVIPEESWEQKVTDVQVKEYIELLLPMEKEPTPIQRKNIIRLREDMMKRYYDAPDLQKVGNNAYRFLNAASDFATHSDPLRRTANYNENLFARTVDGNPIIDRAYQLVKAA